MVNIETIKYVRESLEQAGCSKNEKAWKACECLNSSGNDIGLGDMATLFGVERFRVSRTNVIFAGGSNEMVKAYKDGSVPLNVAYRIVSKVPVAQRDKALQEYLAAPKGKHGRRNPKPGLVRGDPEQVIERCISRIDTQLGILSQILDHAGADLCLASDQQLTLAEVRLACTRLLKLSQRMEANV